MNIPPILRNRLIQAAGGGAIAISMATATYFENTFLFAHKDPIGIWTSCTGHTGPDVTPGKTYTKAECLRLLEEDMAEAVAVFDRWVPLSVRDDMAEPTKAAFYDFIFNVGPGAPGKKDGFVWLKSGRHSTMLRLLRDGRVRDACEQFQYWTTAGGRVFRGLVIRRQAEAQLCREGMQ